MEKKRKTLADARVRKMLCVEKKEIIKELSQSLNDVNKKDEVEGFMDFFFATLGGKSWLK